MADAAQKVADTAFDRWGFTLPVPFRINDKEINSFELGPVRGRLRRELANLSGKAEPWETLAVLKHVVTDLGGLGPPDSNLLRRLPMPSAEYILFVLQLQRMPEVPFEAPCTVNRLDGDICGNILKVTIPMKDIGVIEANTEMFYSDRGEPCVDRHFSDPVTGKRICVRYKLSNLGDVIKFVDKMIDRGAERMGDTAFEEASATMIDYDDMGRGLTVQELEDLPYDTAAALLEQGAEVHPASVDTDLDIECERCGGEAEMPLPLKRWLVPLAPKKED